MRDYRGDKAGYRERERLAAASRRRQARREPGRVAAFEPASRAVVTEAGLQSELVRAFVVTGPADELSLCLETGGGKRFVVGLPVFSPAVVTEAGLEAVSRKGLAPSGGPGERRNEAGMDPNPRRGHRKAE